MNTTRSAVRLITAAAILLSMPFTRSEAGQMPALTWQICQQYAPNVSIEGCTDVINSGQDSSLDLAEAYRYRGIAYLRAGDYSAAIADEEQSSQLNPMEVSPFLFHGLALYKQGRLRAAMQDFNIAISRSDEFYEAIYARGMTERKLGLMKQADADFDNAMNMQGDVTQRIRDLGLQP